MMREEVRWRRAGNDRSFVTWWALARLSQQQQQTLVYMLCGPFNFNLIAQTPPETDTTDRYTLLSHLLFSSIRKEERRKKGQPETHTTRERSSDIWLFKVCCITTFFGVASLHCIMDSSTSSASLWLAWPGRIGRWIIFGKNIKERDVAGWPGAVIGWYYLYVLCIAYTHTYTERETR